MAYLDRCYGNDLDAPWHNVEASSIRGALQASLGGLSASAAPESLVTADTSSLDSGTTVGSSAIYRQHCSVCSGLGLVGTPPVRCSLCALSAIAHAAPEMAPETILSTITGPESTMDESRNAKLADAILRKVEPYALAYSQRASALHDMVRQVGPERAFDTNHDALVKRRHDDLRSMIISALAQAEAA